MMFFTKTIVLPFRDFLFVTRCFHCGERLKENESRICGLCWDSLSSVKDGDFTFKVLQERFQSGGVIDGFLPLYYFEKGKVLQTLAHSLKYQEITAFGVELGKKIGERLRAWNPDAIIPVPLNKRKERERGFNQAEYIARGAGAILKKPVLLRTVRRKKYTVSQTTLNAEERKNNIADAFQITDRSIVKGKRICLVDDVVTTGSTIQEVAVVVKKAGATAVMAASAGLAKLGEDS